MEILKHHAYQNMDNLKSIHKTPLSCLRPLECVGMGQSDATEQGLQRLNISTQQEGIPFDFTLVFDLLTLFQASY